MNYCYYATHNPHGHLDYSDSSGSDSETASASASASSSSSTSRSRTADSPILPRRMNLLDLDMIKLINTGGSAKVYLVLDKIEHHPLALKVIPKSKPLLFHISNREKVTEEKVIHSFLTMERDDFFLPLVATWSDRENFYLASEYIPGGDLALRIMQQRTFDEAEARFYIAELIVALEHLHAHKIIHRDIKPSNILIRPDGHILLADFGVSKRFDAEDSFDTSTDSDDSSHYDSAVQEEFLQLGVGSSCASREAYYMTSDDCGTPYFMSPEQHRGDKYSFEVDYWAVGVILYRMVTGRMPFGDCAMHKGQIARSVLEDDVSFAGHSSTTISMVTQDFILGLLAKDPSHRLHPSHIRSHPFFYGINWAQVETRQLPAPWHPYIAPIPKHSRAIFAGYRDDSASCLLKGGTPENEFTWYSSPYHARSRPPYSQHPHRTHGNNNVKKPGGGGGTSTSSIPLSFSFSFDGKWKSWIQSVVFCARDGRKASSRTRRRKGRTSQE